MKATRRQVLVSLAGTAIVAASSQAFAQQRPLGKQVVGGWTLVSAYNEKDGKRTDLLGPRPQGYMTFSDNGRFTFQAFEPGKAANFKEANRLKATGPEAQAVVASTIAYFGTYKVNEKDGVMDWNIEHSVLPNNIGQAKRNVKLSGDELIVTNQVARVGGVNTFIWKRAK